jgi:hypothetical protein
MGNTLLKKNIANYQKAIDIPSPTANKNFQQPSERQRRTATAKSQVAQHSMIFAAAVGSKGPKVRKYLDEPNGKHRQVAAVK